MRLIDADELKVEIANYFLSCVDKGKIVIDITEMQVELYKIINSQPTVYNLEKIVEEIENDENQITFGGISFREPLIKVAADAIDIMKKRGVK